MTVLPLDRLLSSSKLYSTLTRLARTGCSLSGKGSVETGPAQTYGESTPGFSSETEENEEKNRNDDVFIGLNISFSPRQNVLMLLPVKTKPERNISKGPRARPG